LKGNIQNNDGDGIIPVNGGDDEMADIAGGGEISKRKTAEPSVEQAFKNWLAKTK